MRSIPVTRNTTFKLSPVRHPNIYAESLIDMSIPGAGKGVGVESYYNLDLSFCLFVYYLLRQFWTLGSPNSAERSGAGKLRNL